MTGLEKMDNHTEPATAHAALSALTCVAFAVFAAFVFEFGRHGEAFTGDIDAACAEAAFKSAKKLERLGNPGLAIQRYRQALDGRFADKEREYLCVRSLGEMLYRLGRYAEAADAFGRLPVEAFKVSGSFTGYVGALLRAGDYAEAERLGRQWLALAGQERDSRQALWANDALGRVYIEMDRPGDALARYRAAETIDPTGQAGIHVAQILHSQDRTRGAVEQLEAFLKRVSAGERHEDAKRLLKHYRSRPSSR